MFNIPETSYTLVKMMIPAFMAILFLQSSLDKIMDYKGNLAYFTDHFKNSPLAKMVVVMTPVLTILEFMAGVLCAIGTVSIYTGNKFWAFSGLIVAAVSLLSLFFGQRVAKDYAGALSIAVYFGVNVLGLLILV
jgi:putative oxidoreductase